MIKTSQDDLDIDNDTTIIQLVKYAKPYGWEETFEKCYPNLKKISSFIENRRKHVRIVPDKINIFRAFHLIRPENIRVVIIGQDPSPIVRPNGKCVATGLSFSTEKDYQPQPYFQNIIKEIKRFYPNCKIGNHGCLDRWSIEEGIFMLNASLTTEEGVYNAHGKDEKWIPLISEVLETIAEKNPRCIYVIWGSDAQKLLPYIKAKDTHILLSGSPSPKSYSLGNNPFEKNGHFKQINKLLDPKNEKIGKGKVHHWSLLKGPVKWDLDIDENVLSDIESQNAEKDKINIENKNIEENKINIEKDKINIENENIEKDKINMKNENVKKVKNYKSW